MAFKTNRINIQNEDDYYSMQLFYKEHTYIFRRRKPLATRNFIVNNTLERVIQTQNEIY